MSEPIVTLQQIRDVGLLVATADDATVRSAIRIASAFIERRCGVPFLPRTFTKASPFLMDGSGSDVLWLPWPVLSISEAGYQDTAGTQSALSATSYAVFNRRPPSMDDRRNPKLQLRDLNHWTEGLQNIYLAGVFGYCDANTAPIHAPLLVTDNGPNITLRVGSILDDSIDYSGKSVRVTYIGATAAYGGTETVVVTRGPAVSPSAPTGTNVIVTTGLLGQPVPASTVASNYSVQVVGDWAPLEIQRAAIMLVVNDYAWSLTSDRRQRDRLRRWLMSETTEGHSYTLSALAMSGGPSGIREVDKILAAYSKPVAVWA